MVTRLGEIVASSREQELEEALRICKEVLLIASDWNAPEAYDIEVPPSWQDTIDPDGNEPTWPTLYGVINKCQSILDRTSDHSANVNLPKVLQILPTGGIEVYQSYPTTKEDK